VEIQALTSKVASGYPARRVSGVDFNRVNMLIAVLNRRIGMPLHEQDIYVNAVGGVKIDEPCADLGIALAIASSFCNKPIYADAIAIGEVGLAGEVRGVSHINLRIAEAKRLGFKLAVIPKHNLKSVGKIEGLEIKAVSTLYEPLTLLNIL
jgi:DNA repair protein RadA/Sms